MQAEENARIKLELEILKKQMKDNDSRYGALIENAKKQEISTTLQLNDLDSKTRNRITEIYIGMEKKIEKLQGENDLFKIKDLEKDNKVKTLEAGVKVLEEKDIKKDKEIESLKTGAESLKGFIAISLTEMKNIASTAKDSINTANFFKTNLLSIIDKQVEMNDNLFQSNKQSCGKKITQYTTKKAEVSDMKFKLGTEIDSLTELINNRINVQANVRKRNDLENQITECNDANNKLYKSII